MVVTDHVEASVFVKASNGIHELVGKILGLELVLVLESLECK